MMLFLAHHTSGETAAAFRVSERQVRRILRDSMDAHGCASEYELFRKLERRPKREHVRPLSLW
jgi:hypothetical protein